MDMSMHMERINLVKSLNGTYKKADKEMVVQVLKTYKDKYNCSYKYAYEMMVDGNPSYSAYTAWRRKLSQAHNKASRKNLVITAFIAIV